MSILELLQKETDRNSHLVMGIALVSGLSNSALLIIINQAAQNDASGKDNTYLFIVCLVCVGLYLTSNRYVQRKSAEKIESIIRNIRIRIINKIRHTELEIIEEVGHSEIYSRVTTDILVISRSIDTIIQGFQSAILVFFSFIYIGFMSIKALFVILGVILLGAVSFYRTASVTEKIYTKAAEKQNDFLTVLNGFLLGFKEIKINSVKNEEAFGYFRVLTEESSNLQVSAMFSMVNSNLISRFLFYMLLITIIFIIPAYEDTPNENVVKISAAILFILSPLEGLIGAIPKVVEANASSHNIVQLEEKIESQTFENPLSEDKEKNQANTISALPFESALTLSNISFQYPRKYETDGFAVGPIDMTIAKGQVTFITGGNGSGKSTLLKLLCGLYYPKTGEFRVDQIKVSPHNIPNYREMLSIVLTDFHLFDRLFGLSDIHQAKVDQLLKLMEIQHKITISGGKISNLNLSTGQRKRLALAIALLEDKPIYIFDEIAADQDPSFKKYFYREILNQMKKEGKTVIVVTHDSEYFDVADKCYKLQHGLLNTYIPD